MNLLKVVAIWHSWHPGRGILIRRSKEVSMDKYRNKMGIFSVFVSAFAAILAVSSASAANNGVNSCNDLALFNYKNGTLYPLYPAQNMNTTLIVDFDNIYKQINDGTLDLQVNLNGLPYSSTEPLCSVNLPCPIELGSHTVYSNPINVGTMSGKLVVTLTYKDTDDSILLCVRALLNLPSNSLMLV